ncbi:unnamed protein product [Cuscuta epithymum]|uniref:FBD domain-containing protein n=1 Tax=Cuscuta epithymum TaxID=186058 RepID=A0AAV0C6L7_9ASTE|nr:unnamed protein product [Cuscuta epithymum]
MELLRNASKSIPGILGLLESSPDIETLVISAQVPFRLDHDWAPPAKDNLVCDLLRLKTIKFISLVDPQLDGEPLLTLARILLKRTPVLEEMSVYIDWEHIDNYVKIEQTLLSYPRSSPKAVIHLLNC